MDIRDNSGNKLLCGLATAFFTLSFHFSQAQNLVPNSSFENYTTCPSTLGEIYQCQSWASFGRSPDYFNSCSTNSITSVPNNYYGFQYAATGNAYCGIVPYSVPFPSSEYIGAQLSQPLTLFSGQKILSKHFRNLKSREWNLKGRYLKHQDLSETLPPPTLTAM